MKIKQQQHTIKRKIHHQWNILQIKQYLDLRHIRYACIPRIYKSILKIRFKNQDDQDLADTQLEVDIFNEHNYQEFISNQPS
jgi:tRNA isopentenyl-2-thiomethyl-A-37 hydroxylase MiaE